MIFKLNQGQRAALDAVMAGKNVFVTGEGGTGKSVAVDAAVRHLRAAGKEVAICAPTGVAAQNVGGVTIHSAFRFSLAPKVADELGSVGPSKVINKADTVIIDEIGMVRRDLMDAIARVVELSNETRAATGREPLQLVVVGDFSQLPPVVTPNDKPALVGQYGPESADTGFYAFEADGWRRMGFEVCQLTEPMRQADPLFVAMLNRARVGDASCLPYFNHLAGRGPAPASAVSIVARNKQAASVNEGRLAALDGDEKVFEGTVQGKFKPSDMAAPQRLALKVGARVMCLVNNADEGYINGSTGTVADLDGLTSGGLPAVIVTLDGSGRNVAVARYEWENAVYEVVERDGKSHLHEEVIGTYRQFPLKLCWCVTYHKCQGQTLDAVSIDPDTFGAGMLYVGLSRATGAAGIYLTREIAPGKLAADPDVVAFYESCGWVPPAPATGEEAPELPPAPPEPPSHQQRSEKPKKQGERAAGARQEKVPKLPTVLSYSTSGDAEPAGADDLERIEAELHELIGSGGRTWVRVYELLDRVHARKLYEPGFRSFSAWLRAEARREGVAESLLWHRKSAGDFYSEWKAANPGAPALADGEGLSEDNLNLVRKIAKVDAGRADALMSEMVAGGLSTKELRREWREMRPASKPAAGPEAPAPAVAVDAEARRLTFASAADFERAVAVLREAGII